MGTAVTESALVALHDMKPRFVFATSNHELSHGETSLLQCRVLAVPSAKLQWQLNGVDIPGETANVLRIVVKSEEDFGSYSCFARNSVGYATTEPIEVRPRPTPPVFAQHPAGRITLLGENINLQCAVSCLPPPTLQWYKDGVALPSATAGVLRLLAVGFDDIGKYHVVATNPFGSASSRVVDVGVSGLVPRILQQPKSQVGAPGEVITLAVRAAGHPEPAYQWQRNGIDLAGETAACCCVTLVSVRSCASADGFCDWR